MCWVVTVCDETKCLIQLTIMVSAILKSKVIKWKVTNGGNFIWIYVSMLCPMPNSALTHA